jgi:hypothetical protein
MARRQAPQLPSLIYDQAFEADRVMRREAAELISRSTCEAAADALRSNGTGCRRISLCGLRHNRWRRSVY